MTFETGFLILEGALTGFAVLNSLFWRDLELNRLSSSLAISVLIPARNEARNLERLLPSLLQNHDPKLEILVLDDHSGDDTADVVRGFAAQDSRVRLLAGQDLPAGWLGKNWACHQLSLAASGEVLIFTDADTKWQINSPRAMASTLEREGLGGLCAWPAQRVDDPISRLIQPLQQWSLLAFLPLFFVPLRTFPVAVAANGQCLAFTRAAYTATGGHAGVRDQVLEDMALARGVKRSGGRFRVLNGANAVTTRMYGSASEAFAGYAKNVYPAFGGTPLAFVAATVFNLGLYVAPWIWLISTWRLEAGFQAGLCVLFSLVARAISDLRAGYDLRFTALHPISVLVWAYIGAVSMRGFMTGKVSWKGRSYDLRRPKP